MNRPWAEVLYQACMLPTSPYIAKQSEQGFSGLGVTLTVKCSTSTSDHETLHHSSNTRGLFVCGSQKLKQTASF
jgi:hypothetical protein